MPRVTRALVLLACLALAMGGGCAGGEGQGEVSPTQDQDEVTPTQADPGTVAGKNFDGDGYAFTHPASWSEIPGATTRAGSGREIMPPVYLGPPDRSDLGDALAVSVYRVNIPVTEENIEEVLPQLVAEVEAVLEQGGMRVINTPVRVTVAGLPGLRLDASFLAPDGKEITSQQTYFFDRKTEYLVLCEFTPGRAEEIKRGCDQVLDSFQVK